MFNAFTRFCHGFVTLINKIMSKRKSELNEALKKTISLLKERQREGNR